MFKNASKLDSHLKKAIYQLLKFYPTVLTVDSAKDDKKNLGASSKEKSFCLDSLSEMFSPPFLAKGNWQNEFVQWPTLKQQKKVQRPFGRAAEMLLLKQSIHYRYLHTLLNHKSPNMPLVFSFGSIHWQLNENPLTWFVVTKRFQILQTWLQNRGQTLGSLCGLW